MKRNIHIWIGTSSKEEEEYLKYFELDYETEDFEDPNYRVCGFCKDIGEVWYDEDFIGIIPLFEEEVGVDELIATTPLGSVSKKSVREECLKLGIKKGNAIFFISDTDLNIEQPYKDNYNELKYIGKFPV